MDESNDQAFEAEFLAALGSTERRASLVQWLRSMRTAGSNTRRVPSNEDSSPRKLVEAWDKLWASRLAHVVQERVPPVDTAAAGGGLQVPDTPGVDFWELVEKRYEFSSLPVDLLRKSRRWWKKFDLDAMIEDRIYADYRDVLEKERGALVDSAREVEENCEALRGRLSTCADETKKCSEPEILALGEQFNAITRALRQTQDTCGAFLGVLDDQKFRVCFYEAIRSLHADVQDAWGTWSRRIRAPLLSALIALVAVIVLVHPLFGLLTGSSTALPLLLLLPIAVFMSRYYLGLKHVRQLIDSVVARVAVFNPEPTKAWSAEVLPTPLTQSKTQSSGSKFASLFGRKSQPIAVEPELAPAPETFLLTENTVWNPGMRQRTREGAQSSLKVRELANGAYRLTIELPGRSTSSTWSEIRRKAENSARAEEGEEILHVVKLAQCYAESGPGSRGTSTRIWRWVPWLFGALICSLLLLLRLVGDANSRVTVYSTAANGLCALASGYMAWPGPGDLLLISLDDEQGADGARWMRIPSTHVRAVEGYREQRRLCKDTGRVEVGSGPSSPSTINFYQGGHSVDRAMFVVPFSVEFGKSEGREAATIKCNFEAEAAAIPAEMRRVLRRVGDGLRACGRRVGGPTRIDVRGFASSVPFAGACSGLSEMKNLELAEMRRNSVLHAMFGDGQFPGRYPDSWVWKVDGVVIEPSGPKRFTSFEHLSDVSGVRDEGSSDRYIAQRAEIWVLASGGCTSRSLLSAQTP